ncbi:MAG: glycosyltransferase family 2 protein [Phycisphaeraceae bacterium]
MTAPRLSVVIPSFNQADYLAATLDSVLDQRYPNLQLMVIDGGSTDGSTDIIRHYAPHLDLAISEPDNGQTHAINKGLRHADGDLVTWVCSDDTLLPGSLDAVANLKQAQPQARWVAGRCQQIDQHGEPILIEPRSRDISLRTALLRTPTRPFHFPQPGVWWDPKLHHQHGYLDESLHYAMDFAWWLTLLKEGHHPVIIDQPLATYRMHPQSKTCAHPSGFIGDHVTVERAFARDLSWSERVSVFRRTAYQQRAAYLETLPRRPWIEILTHPWWLLSQQVRAHLWHGPPHTRVA